MNFLQYNHENLLSEDLLLKQNLEFSKDIPNFHRLEINHSSGKFNLEEKTYLAVSTALQLFSGQSTKIDRAKKACANFKVLNQDILGSHTSLNRKQILNMLTQLYLYVFPRISDFMGLPEKQVSSRGFSLSLKNLFILPELEDNSQFFENISGFTLNVQTKTKSVQEVILLLSGFHIPIYKIKKSQNR
uniref:Ribosomal protein L5 n=1 Tax=Pyramimonas parkeae TaxID=36894 RepID=A0A1D8I1T4_9CHLO|nr:ribosomal protein L5 [Pyramimonas parkeae]AOT98943.1 ribosomal protein L5 [Pyramimonas parkeae]